MMVAVYMMAIASFFFLMWQSYLHVSDCRVCGHIWRIHVTIWSKNQHKICRKWNSCDLQLCIPTKATNNLSLEITT